MDQEYNNFKKLILSFYDILQDPNEAVDVHSDFIRFKQIYKEIYQIDRKMDPKIDEASRDLINLIRDVEILIHQVKDIQLNLKKKNDRVLKQIGSTTNRTYLELFRVRLNLEIQTHELLELEKKINQEAIMFCNQTTPSISFYIITFFLYSLSKASYHFLYLMHIFN